MTGRLGSTTGGLRAAATSAVRTLARAPGRVALILVLGLGASALATLAPAASASADSIPVPFTCLTPTDFVLSGSTLYSAAEPATGLPTPASGQPSSLTKLTDDFPDVPNALGFDPADGLLYAVTVEGDGDHLLQIDSTGTVTDLGLIPDDLPSVVTGGFDPSGTFWVTGGNAGTDDAWAIDVSASPLTVTKYTMSQAWATNDWTYAGGYFWGYSEGVVWQFDPATDDVHTYGTTNGGLDYEGAWTFANGDLGFFDANSGTAVRVTITTNSSGNPTYSTDNTGSGWPGGTSGDAASCAQV
ncbi:MAG TPA: hypothetical protein VEH05_18945, partial [Streptosporangiaceae bacterium]|nr:hypothetical protein [Streptosporangiaceae bacterium]